MPPAWCCGSATASPASVAATATASTPIAARFEADRLIVATGGLSIPKLGATGLAFDIARHFGVPVVDTAPALVPFTFGGDDQAGMKALAGVSLRVAARCGRAGFEEAMLFTHRGLSGPALLQLSSYWQPGQEISLVLAPGQDVAGWLRQRRRDRGKAGLATVLAEILPQRLARPSPSGRARPAPSAACPARCWMGWPPGCPAGG